MSDHKAQHKAGTGLHDRMRQVLRELRPQLLPIMDKIVILFAPLAPKSAQGTERYGNIKKVSDDLAVLTDKAFEYKYKITLFEDSWQELDEKGQRANLFRLLCHIDHKEDKDENDVFFLRNPEYHYFGEELEHFGVWQADEQHHKLVDILDGLRQAIQGAAAIIRTTSSPQVQTPVVKVAVPASPAPTKGGGTKAKKAPPRITGLRPPTFGEEASKEIEEQLVSPDPQEEEPEEDNSHMDLDL
jgi:hypothetical protein